MANNNEHDPRGSIWRKWDFQVHTPASHLNNQFGADWDVYVQNLFRTAISKEIAVIALTDYFTIDGYKKVKEDYLHHPAKLAELFTAEEVEAIAGIRVLANVEFRLDKLINDSRVNAHVIFSDELLRFGETDAAIAATKEEVDEDGAVWSRRALSTSAADQRQSTEGETLKAIQRICQKCEKGGNSMRHG